VTVGSGCSSLAEEGRSRGADWDGVKPGPAGWRLWHAVGESGSAYTLIGNAESVVDRERSSSSGFSGLGDGGGSAPDTKLKPAERKTALELEDIANQPEASRYKSCVW